MSERSRRKSKFSAVLFLIFGVCLLLASCEKTDDYAKLCEDNRDPEIRRKAYNAVSLDDFLMNVRPESVVTAKIIERGEPYLADDPDEHMIDSFTPYEIEITESMAGTLKKGDRVTLAGFYVAMNGVVVIKPSGDTPVFSVGAEYLIAMDPVDSERVYGGVDADVIYVPQSQATVKISGNFCAYDILSEYSSRSKLLSAAREGVKLMNETVDDYNVTAQRLSAYTGTYILPDKSVATLDELIEKSGCDMIVTVKFTSRGEPFADANGLLKTPYKLTVTNSFMGDAKSGDELDFEADYGFIDYDDKEKRQSTYFEDHPLFRVGGEYLLFLKKDGDKVALCKGYEPYTAVIYPDEHFRRQSDGRSLADEYGTPFAAYQDTKSLFNALSDK